MIARNVDAHLVFGARASLVLIAITQLERTNRALTVRRDHRRATVSAA